MIKDNIYKISVITATYNSESCIFNLIESLRNQKDKDFEWVVIDGTSTDKTLEILNKIDDLNIKIISEPDFGIYDALNKGIRACSGEYYLVAGADDIFFENAIYDYKKNIKIDFDLITANVVMGGRVIKPNIGPAWRSGMFHWISQHSVGVLIRKKLHLQFGFYSNKYPIGADQLFIKKCCLSGHKCEVINTVVGEFNLKGTSGLDQLGGLTDFFRIQLETNENKLLQYILFTLRLCKRYFKT